MIRAELGGGVIDVAADAPGALIAARLPGATRTRTMPPRTWRMPLTLDSFAALKGAGALISNHLATEAQRMQDIQHFVDTQKQTESVEPIAPVPLKEGRSLYNHQVKAFNISLALMGYIK